MNELTLSRGSWHAKFLEHYPIPGLRMEYPPRQFCPYMRALLGRMILLAFIAFMLYCTGYEWATGFHELEKGVATTVFQNLRAIFGVLGTIVSVLCAGIGAVVLLVKGIIKLNQRSGRKPKYVQVIDDAIDVWNKERAEWSAAFTAWLNGGEIGPEPKRPRDLDEIIAQLKWDRRSSFAKLVITYAKAFHTRTCPRVSWTD